MFIKGLKQPLREKLALVDPNPRSLAQLTSTVLNIESLIKRNEKVEYYRRNEDIDDPMEIDLYRIKRGPNDVKYTSRTKNYIETKGDHSEERKKGICYRCKQSGHFSFNCPNRIKPKNLKIIRKGKEIDEENQTNVRRIRKLEDNEEIFAVREINFVEKPKP